MTYTTLIKQLVLNLNKAPVANIIYDPRFATYSQSSQTQDVQFMLFCDTDDYEKENNIHYISTTKMIMCRDILSQAFFMGKIGSTCQATIYGYSIDLDNPIITDRLVLGVVAEDMRLAGYYYTLTKVLNHLADIMCCPTEEYITIKLGQPYVPRKEGGFKKQNYLKNADDYGVLLLEGGSFWTSSTLIFQTLSWIIRLTHYFTSRGRLLEFYNYSGEELLEVAFLNYAYNDRNCTDISIARSFKSYNVFYRFIVNLKEIVKEQPLTGIDDKAFLKVFRENTSYYQYSVTFSLRLFNKLRKIYKGQSSKITVTPKYLVQYCNTSAFMDYYNTFLSGMWGSNLSDTGNKPILWFIKAKELIGEMK